MDEKENENWSEITDDLNTQDQSVQEESAEQSAQELVDNDTSDNKIEENTSEVSEENEANQMPVEEVVAPDADEVFPKGEGNSDEQNIKKEDDGDSK